MSVRGISMVVLPAVKNVRLKRYACAAIANASVLIASSSPRTRNAPDSHHDRDEARERTRRAGAPTGTRSLRCPPSRNRVPCQPMLNCSPRISAAAVSAPRPANAI